MGCIYFDHKYGKAGRGRGYGYVAVSRFRSRGGCFLYGHKRRTDFLPVGGNPEEEVLERGYDSVTDDDEEGCGLEYAMGDDDEQQQKFCAIVEGLQVSTSTVDDFV